MQERSRTPPPLHLSPLETSDNTLRCADQPNAATCTKTKRLEREMPCVIRRCELQSQRQVSASRVRRLSREHSEVPCAKHGPEYHKSLRGRSPFEDSRDEKPRTRSIRKRGVRQARCTPQIPAASLALNLAPNPGTNNLTRTPQPSPLALGGKAGSPRSPLRVSSRRLKNTIFASGLILCSSLRSGSSWQENTRAT